MCDNILEFLPYMYAIYTSQELSADPNYDPMVNRTWWECFIQWIMTPFRWIDSLDNNVKMLAGVALLALAIALTIATGGAPAAVVGALCGSMLVSIAIGGIGGGIISAINGGSFAEGMLDGASDAILWGGLFAFVGAALQSVKRVAEGALQSKIRVADCTGQCFIAGTLVLTEEGYQKIEEIKIGDKVLSYDEETGEQGYKEVVRLFRNKTEEWYHIVAGEEEIVCTGGHPFYVEGEGFVEAKDLKISDVLLLSDGKSVTVKQIGYEKLVDAETTYNFEVRDYHTYYVSESGILVHNDCVTKLYRAMSNAEYGSLTKHGRFKYKLGTMQDKWMATTYDDAVAWGNKLMGQGNFRVVEIRVPTESLGKMFHIDYNLDGVGHGYCAYFKFLNEVMLGFRRLL